MDRAQAALDRLADGVPYEALARSFLEFERGTGDDPIVALATAAAATTGQRRRTGVEPAVERFREAFVETGRAPTFAALADVPLEDDALVEALGARRKRHVLLESARVLADRPEAEDLAALSAWAARADVYRYRTDPIGTISGVGPSTFQFLRQLAGVDAAKPDGDLKALLETVASGLDSAPIDTSEPLRTIASCEWLARVTDYRMLEIDRLAWWTRADAADREAAMA